MSLFNSYAVRHPLRGVVVNVLLLATLLLLFYGLQAPILTLEKFYFFSNTVSLLSALQQLAQQAEWGLFALVGTFSVLFPILKILTLLLIWNLDAAQGEGHRRRLEWYTLNRAFDIGKARRELGYVPRTSLEDGLRSTWAWYQAEGLL